MGHIENILHRCVKKDGEGRAVYFPFGVFGPGRVIADAAVEGRLLRLLKYVQYIGIPLLAMAAGSGGYIWPAIALYFAVYYAGVYHILAGCQSSSERLTLSEYVGNFARAGAGFIWASAFAGLVMLAACVAMIALGETPKDRLLGLACAVFFGYFEAIALWALRIKYSAAQADSRK